MERGPGVGSPGRYASNRTIRPSKIRRSRAGLHWFNRESGLNVLLDDVRVPQAEWHRAPRYVSIALTNACELRCAFCYAPKVPGRLGAQAVLSWIQELDAEGCLGIGFGGGEPTAHPDFAQLCVRAAETTGLAVTFTTHAHRIGTELAAALRGSVHFIRVSMDGVGDTYERIRGRTFDDFRRRLEHVATIAPFGLNVVVNGETVRQLDEVRAFAEQTGAVELLLLPEQPVAGRPGISTHDTAELGRWVVGTTAGVRLAISQANIPEGVPLAEPFVGEPALDAHAHIDALGMLRRHAYDHTGVKISHSVLQALDDLQTGRTA